MKTPNPSGPRAVRLAAITFSMACSCVMAQESYTVCAEASIGGASLYWKGNVADPKARELAGFRLDVTQSVFQRLNSSFLFRGDLPWSRCMRLVADGEIDFAVGAYYDLERARQYAFSKPFQTLTPQVYLRKASNFQIKSTADLKKFKGCGMNGSSYVHYGLEPGELEQGAINYAGLIQKLKAERCDYFVEELEVIQGLESGRYRDDPALRNNGITGARAPARHFVTRLGGRGEALLPDLNAALDTMRRSGELERLWKVHSAPRP